MQKNKSQPSSGGEALAGVKDPDAGGAAGLGPVVEVVIGQRGNVVGRHQAVPRPWWIC